MFDDAVQRIADPAPASSSHPEGWVVPRAPYRIRHVSAGVASLHLEWPDPDAPDGWAAGEVRVLQVQSGLTPRTELMIAAPVTVPADAARRFLESLAASVQRALSLATPA